MGALDNASKLGKDATFRDWVTAAGCYVARNVAGESVDTPAHEARLGLAKAILNNPEVFVNRLVWVIASDPDVATKGATASLVGEQTVIDKVTASWTALSTL